MPNNRLEQLLQFWSQTPNDPFIIYALATEYVTRGNDSEALKYYLILQMEHPDYVGFYYHLGKLYQRQHNFKEAETIFNKGIEVSQAIKDHHAFSELKRALQELIDEQDD